MNMNLLFYSRRDFLLIYEKSNQNNTLPKSIKASIVGIVVGSVVCILLLMLFSFMFVKAHTLPIKFIEPIVIIISCIGTFISGYITSRIIRKNGMMYGIISGFLMFVILFIAGLIVCGDSITTIILVKCTSMLLVGAVGGIFGVNSK